MGSAFGNLKILHHEDHIRPLDRCQMVGNDHTGLAFHQAVQRLEDCFFRLSIEP